jgi:putative transposase
MTYKTNFAKKKLDPNFNFDIGFRSKKTEQSITIPKEAIKLILDGNSNALKMYPTFLTNQLKFFYRKRDIKKGKQITKIIYDCKLIQNKLGKIYLVVPHRVEACDNQASQPYDWGALDPGVRTFQTIFSPSGVAFKIGDRDISRIARLCLHLDKLLAKSKDKTIKSKKRGKYQKAYKRLSDRIKNLVKEVHWKTISFLTENFKNIIIPPFNVSQMVKRKNRKINSKTVRNMLCWSHYAFRMRLMHKAELKGVKVFVRGEEYTTKTCTNCLRINHNVKGEKVLKCPFCKTKVDRDLSGARNEFLKNICVI